MTLLSMILYQANAWPSVEVGGRVSSWLSSLQNLRALGAA